MYFRAQKKTAGDVSLSECIETGKDANALSLMDVICADEDLFENLSTKEMNRQLYDAMARALTPRERTDTLRYTLAETFTGKADDWSFRLAGAGRRRVRFERLLVEKLGRGKNLK